MMNEITNALKILVELDVTFLIFITTTFGLAVAALALYVVLKVVTSQTKGNRRP
ncbi:hypothetical protein Q3O60_05280 [Alkalimonas collagenimarina]|uniref:Oxaloacetate decarboxylase, gamma chain n=1 Tax=Alkalimonas collagenimarina TaxID=400390 RepID=A0ABT9GX08_9GAMM|nr:hypothetical protein [Alkalimonas collagenimarina]MDP4535591.1 hypothetical protein [Alkalimonas collagenimarina]